MTLEGIRAIFQDIDGCLNPADGEPFSAVPDAPLSASQARILESITRAVDATPIEHFILNTGRPLNLMTGILQHLDTPKARYLLLEHACVLYDRKLGRTINCKSLAEANRLDDLARRYSQVDTFEQVFAWYRNGGQARLESEYQTALPALEKVANLSIEIPKNIKGDQLLERIETLMHQVFDPETLAGIQFLRSDSFIDILPGIDKLDGIHLLSAHLRVDLDHALAVGDFLNDLPVFEEFHRVLCPANAHPKIRELPRSKGELGHVSDQAYGPALLDFLQQL